MNQGYFLMTYFPFVLSNIFYHIFGLQHFKKRRSFLLTLMVAKYCNLHGPIKANSRSYTGRFVGHVNLCHNLSANFTSN